jgi:urease accessory protein
MKSIARALPGAIFATGALLATGAQAHSPIEGLGAFYSHFFHPVLAPAHALLLVASALMLGQQERAVARLGVVALAASTGLGLIVVNAGLLDQVAERFLLVAAASVGSLVILGRRLPVVIPVAAAFGTGLALAIDSGSEAVGASSAILNFAGLAAGSIYIGTLITGLTVDKPQPWLRIGVRIAGSWIVAATMLVLALSFAPPSTRRISTGEIVVTMASPC